MLAKEIDDLAPEYEERTRSSQRGCEHVTRAIGSPTKREGRTDSAGFLAQRAIQIAGHVPLLVEELEPLLRDSSQTKGTVHLVKVVLP
jgi:hypothetical protein